MNMDIARVFILGHHNSEKIKLTSQIGVENNEWDVSDQFASQFANQSTNQTKKVIHFWDYSGQNINISSWLFTNNNIYILMVDNFDCESNVKILNTYLFHIRSKAPNAPIVLVTQYNQYRPCVGYRNCIYQYDLNEYIMIDLNTGQGINQLKNKLFDLAFVSIKYEFVRHHIQSYNETIIEFLKNINSNGVFQIKQSELYKMFKEQSSQSELISFDTFNDLGIIFKIPNSEDIILNPKQFTDILKNVVNHVIAKNNNFVLDHDNLNEISSQHSDNFDQQILKILSDLNLIYQLFDDDLRPLNQSIVYYMLPNINSLFNIVQYINNDLIFNKKIRDAIPYLKSYNYNFGYWVIRFDVRQFNLIIELIRKCGEHVVQNFKYSDIWVVRTYHRDCDNGLYKISLCCIMLLNNALILIPYESNNAIKFVFCKLKNLLKHSFHNICFSNLEIQFMGNGRVFNKTQIVNTLLSEQNLIIQDKSYDITCVKAILSEFNDSYDENKIYENILNISPNEFNMLSNFKNYVESLKNLNNLTDKFMTGNSFNQLIGIFNKYCLGITSEHILWLPIKIKSTDNNCYYYNLIGITKNPCFFNTSQYLVNLDTIFEIPSILQSTESTESTKPTKSDNIQLIVKNDLLNIVNQIIKNFCGDNLMKYLTESICDTNDYVIDWFDDFSCVNIDTELLQEKVNMITNNKYKLVNSLFGTICCSNKRSSKNIINKNQSSNFYQLIVSEINNESDYFTRNKLMSYNRSNQKMMLMKNKQQSKIMVAFDKLNILESVKNIFIHFLGPNADVNHNKLINKFTYKLATSLHTDIIYINMIPDRKLINIIKNNTSEELIIIEEKDIL